MDEKTYTNEPLNNAKLYSFMLENDQRDWLQKEAARKQVSVSRLIREAIEFYMKFAKFKA
jgi:hypothetical protein